MWQFLSGIENSGLRVYIWGLGKGKYSMALFMSSVKRQRSKFHAGLINALSSFFFPNNPSCIFWRFNMSWFFFFRPVTLEWSHTVFPFNVNVWLFFFLRSKYDYVIFFSLLWHCTITFNPLWLLESKNFYQYDSLNMSRKGQQYICQSVWVIHQYSSALKVQEETEKCWEWEM